MYGKESEGLDVYNKDITPYYITGTYIGENPLLHLDTNKTFVQGSSSYIQQPNDYNKINNNSNGHNEHYHITWYEGSGISINNSDKGKIFIEDSVSINSEFCGGTNPSCGCSEYITKGTSTLEAIETPNQGISQPLSYSYSGTYLIPVHKYGIDSISYYHLQNNNYRSEIIDTQDNPNPFKDINGDNIEFSYPVHIYVDELTPSGKSADSREAIDSLGTGNTAYPLNTVRWNNKD
jgi:hypothetical protein